LRESNRRDMVGVVKGERIEAKLLVKRKLGRSMVGGLGKPHFHLNSEGEILGRFWSERLYMFG